MATRALAILGCIYPDLYAGVGVHSGLACGAASDMPSAFAAMRGAPYAVASAERHMPMIVFHGTKDATVNPLNADAVARHGRCADGTSFTRTIRRDETGAEIGETWLIDGAGHAWSGESRHGTYTTSKGPDARREMLCFFGIVRGEVQGMARLAMQRSHVHAKKGAH
jgi:poly(3-hydroxybutyrate) depolymerase